MKNTILVLGSNPQDTTHLRLASEARDIQNSLQSASRKNAFEVRTVLAVRILDLRREMLEHSPSIVHFCGHGTGQSGLVLETSAGEAKLVSGEALADFFRLFSDLTNCVLLNACYSEVQARAIAGHIKYVIGMGDKISDEIARQFSVAFYDGIGAGKPIPFAFELARSAVQLAGLSDEQMPILFRHGVLYSSDHVLSWQENQNESHLSLASLPPPPGLFFGRKRELDLLKNRLFVDSVNDETISTQVVTAVRGWPGIGKTTLASVLARDPDISSRFKDGALWVDLGPDPRWSRALLRLGEALKSDDFQTITSIEDAKRHLTHLLATKNLLLIIDDVWNEEHAAFFQQCSGRDCALLITTRLPRVSEALALRPGSICVLPPLDEADAIGLLKAIVPSVVRNSLEECKELLRDIEYLPLAIHVAGRLLKTEEQLGWGIHDLLDGMRAGNALIRAKAPLDQMSPEGIEIPTVSALLQKSTDRLEEKMREYFALLGPLAPKPARFDVDVLRAGWQVEDPKPIVRALVDRGLLEPVGEGVFQLHAILAAHARSLLDQGSP